MSGISKPRIREIIVVEGRYDKNTLSQAVDAMIIETDGFGLFRDAEKTALIRRLAAVRGAVIMTDSDGAGFLIRNRLKSALAGLDVKHAYIPDIPGRERRKRTPGKAGLLGVEGMPREVIIGALRGAGAVFDDTAPAKAVAPVTPADMFEWGLSGTPDAKSRRAALLAALELPALLSQKALIDVINCLFTREEMAELASGVCRSGFGASESAAESTMK